MTNSPFHRRLARLCRRAVTEMDIDLHDMRVLTEAATGAFSSTAVLAAAAGGEVVAVTRDSRWGTARDAIAEVQALAQLLGVADRISFGVGYSASYSAGCDVVTNLGFVRPIGGDIAQHLSSSAAVALMWEPWEFRPGDLDVDALAAEGIPIIATNEHHPAIRTFDFLGPTVARLLFDGGIEVCQAHIIVIGSEPFGPSVVHWLTAAGALVEFADRESWPDRMRASPDLDAIVLVEHRDHRSIIDERHLAELAHLANRGIPVVRLCGVINREILIEQHVALVPDIDVVPGVMAVTTSYSGPRPVVNLHAGGLKAASIVVRARRNGADAREALDRAVSSGYGLELRVQ